jgi:hypothetical protein
MTALSVSGQGFVPGMGLVDDAPRGSARAPLSAFIPIDLVTCIAHLRLDDSSSCSRVQTARLDEVMLKIEYAHGEAQ